MAQCGLTLRCTRPATAGFARFRRRVNSNVRSHVNQRHHIRIALLASSVALLFLLVACAPLLLFAPAYVAAPDLVFQPLSALWSTYLLPLNLFPKGFLDRTLLVPSSNSLVQFAPQLLLLWFLWALLLFAVFSLLRKARRAA